LGIAEHQHPHRSAPLLGIRGSATASSLDPLPAARTNQHRHPTVAGLTLADPVHMPTIRTRPCHRVGRRQREDHA
jgi:hypothetical protein